MKSLIVYYSYSGNTKRVAEALKEALLEKGEVDIFRLEPEDESDNFFMQSMRAFTGKRAVIKEAPFDVKGYNLVCIGAPVWAFAPAPAFNAYVEGIKNLQGKDALPFVTYGSGIGMKKCLATMKQQLRVQGAFRQQSFSIQQSKVHDKEFILKIVTEVI